MLDRTIMRHREGLLYHQTHIIIYDPFIENITLENLARFIHSFVFFHIQKLFRFATWITTLHLQQVTLMLTERYYTQFFKVVTLDFLRLFSSSSPLTNVFNVGTEEDIAKLTQVRWHFIEKKIVQMITGIISLDNPQWSEFSGKFQTSLHVFHSNGHRLFNGNNPGLNISIFTLPDCNNCVYTLNRFLRKGIFRLDLKEKWVAVGLCHAPKSSIKARLSPAYIQISE